MKILSAEQIRQADTYTIAHEPISSLGLMERAAAACFQWILNQLNTKKKFTVICGTGNNGGDGLVISRMLAEKRCDVEIIILNSSKQSEDFKNNLIALKNKSIPFSEIKEGEQLHLEFDGILIDAIFGTGLSRPITGWIKDCIEKINVSGNKIISIDIPSGLFSDKHTEGTTINADHTLTFQSPKLAFFFPENERAVGQFHVLEIGLDKKFISRVSSQKNYLVRNEVRRLLKKRSKFSHKGDFGHSLLFSGSYGKMGATILATKACLRTGTGLLTVHVPRSAYEIMQISVPEAMTICDENDSYITQLQTLDSKMRIGVGPGIGTNPETQNLVLQLLEESKQPIVIDADALNIISMKSGHIKKIPHHSILTPHLKEFERLAGKSKNDFDRHDRQLNFSVENKVIVVLKGAHTCITTPEGQAYFNSTGNPGMAKGGSGDALTGMILALLSQNYQPEEAAIFGVYLHGLAGDITAREKGENSMIASDLIENIPNAFLDLTT